MKESKYNEKLYRLCKAFLAGTISATDFVDSYMDSWYEKNDKNIVVEVRDKIKDPSMFDAIFTSCDTHESMNDGVSIKASSDEELRAQVEYLVEETDYAAISDVFKQRGWS